MRRCMNGHIGFGEIGTCKKCNEKMLFPNKFWKYGKVEPYATGSTSEVFKILGKEKTYVLKVVLRENKQEAYEQSKNEISILKKLRGCEHVVQLVDYKIENEAVYLLEECYERLTETFWLNLGSKTKIREWGMELCEALIECRDKGIYQLDVQPRNLYLDKAGHARLGDFSIALRKKELETTKDLRGTLAYMAPEVYYEHQYSEQAEIYSLGFLLYCLLNHGMMPFSGRSEAGDPVQRRLSGEPLPFIGGSDWMNFIEKACAWKKEARFQTLEECLQALDELKVEPLYENKESAGFTMPGGFSTSSKMSGGSVNVPVSSQMSSGSATFSAAVESDELIGMFSAPDEMEEEFTAFDADEFAMTVVLPDEPQAVMPEAVPPIGKPVMPSAAPTMEQPVAEKPKTEKLDKVQFSAVAPKEFVKGEYTMVDIFMHEDEYKHVVEEHIGQADTAMGTTKTGYYEVAHNVKVKIVLSSPDIEIEDGVEEDIWTGRYLNFSFAVYVPENYAKRQILFNASVYVNGVITTKLKFPVKMISLREQKMQLLKENVLSAFVSYASQDRQKVAQVIQGMQKARPEMEIFFDVNSLRSGEEWEHILQREIEKRDILFLCWSKNAKESEWVSKEWHYALQNKGADSIEPIPLEPPSECPPPEELKHKHFNDAMLFIINQ